jgi:ligand-binding sensor domain-containing protein
VPGLLQQLLRVVVSAGVLLTFLGPFAVIARASDWLTRTWQTDEGLPDNRVTGVVQSSDGYLWVASYGGLMRFNGAQFEEFSPLHLPGVANRIVRKLHLDRRGRLWLVMDRGVLVCADARTARVFAQADSLLDTRVNVMAEDRAGGLWLACGSTFYRIFDETISQFKGADGLPAGGGSWLAEDGQGELWFARGAQLGVFRAGEWRGPRTFGSSPVRFCAARAGGWASPFPQGPDLPVLRRYRAASS